MYKSLSVEDMAVEVETNVNVIMMICERLVTKERLYFEATIHFYIH